MPREGGDALLRFVRDVVEQKAYAFGTPWLPDGASTLVLPVLRRASGPRAYRLAEEAASGLVVVDPGRLDRLRIRNDSTSAVFVRPGQLFRGRDTPSRGTTEGAVLRPGEIADVGANCVHPSQPLSAGGALELADLPTPESVYGALLAADQGRVWDAVRAARTDVRAPTRDQDPSDDLLDGLSPPDENADVALHTISAPPTQCGAILLDAGGVVAVEVLDHPDSWLRVSRGFYARHAPRLLPAPGAALRPAANPEGAARAASEFFVDLGKTLSPLSRSERRSLRGRLAAYTVHEGAVIHVLAEPVPPIQTPARGVRGFPSAAPVPEHDTAHGLAGMTADDGETVAMASGTIDLEDEAEPSPPSQPRRTRKILTTGWDPTTLEALDAFARKEFLGDRSATVRFLVRGSLGRRGYLGPRPMPESVPEDLLPSGGILESDSGPEPPKVGPRVRELERIALTAEYAPWLRKRARMELERVAESTSDDADGAAARSALERLAPVSAAPEPMAPEEIAAPAPALPEPAVDIAGTLRRALAASVHGNFPEALALFDGVLEAEPENVTALLGRAVAFKRAGKAQEALAGLDLVLALEPGNPAALLNRGRILREHGDLHGALETFDRLVEAARNDWDVWMERGDILARMGRSNAALHSYREALRRKPEDERLRGRIRAMEVAGREAPRPSLRTASLGGIEEGQSYLVQGRTTEPGYRAFRELVGQGVPGLLITRHAETVRQDAGSAEFRVVGLEHARGPGIQDPGDLVSLTAVVERFARENDGRGVILLDGLDLLLAENGSRDAILFVERVNEMILQRRAIFLVLAPPGAVPEKETALLERSLSALPTEREDFGSRLV